MSIHPILSRFCCKELINTAPSWFSEYPNCSCSNLAILALMTDKVHDGAGLFFQVWSSVWDLCSHGRAHAGTAPLVSTLRNSALSGDKGGSRKKTQKTCLYIQLAAECGHVKSWFMSFCTSKYKTALPGWRRVAYCTCVRVFVLVCFPGLLCPTLCVKMAAGTAPHLYSRQKRNSRMLVTEFVPHPYHVFGKL